MANIEWEKYWSLRLSLLTGSMLGRLYSSTINRTLGATLKDAVIISKQGYTMCYLVKENRKKFAEKQIEKYVIRQDVNIFSDFLKKGAESLMDETEMLIAKKKISSDEIMAYLERYCEYNCYHILPRHIIDHVSSDKIDKVLEPLKQARIASEPVHALSEKLFLRFSEQEFGDDRMMFFTAYELESYLKTRKSPDINDVEKRRDAFAIVFEGENFTEVSDHEKIKELESLNLSKNDGNDVKGTTAFNGHVRGTARIVLDPAHVKIFNVGDVLITGMTRPEYVPLMEKASAIVTDSGGLLCHAAIVARELGKPCIIGTQVATKTFKDGDFVEVDANNGMVRKLQKTK